MNKVKNFISAFFAVILLICIIYPVNADAAEVGKEDTLQLFETVEKVELGNISVLEGTTFYGYKQGNEVTLQFSNTYTTVLLEKVKEV
ncbi:hypothetical protein, partial [Oceanobacillus picturae]|uniref:hypothetical protein n=1 Tax=Oceanobacillus picturae TaxID=171693 RepID=UPI000A60A2D9